MRRLVLLVVAVVVVATTAGAASGAQPSLDEARAERDAVQDRLDDAVARLGRIERRMGEVEAEQAALEDELARLRAEAADNQRRLARTVRELYKRGMGASPIAVLLSSDGADEALRRVSTMQQLIAGDTVEAEVVAATRTRLEAVERRMRAREAELRRARDRRDDVVASLRADLERAKQLEQRLERERRARERAAERRAAAASAPGSASVASSGGRACPVGQPRSFTDTWGAPRSGGRSHRGTDILAPYGTPVLAIVSGTWDIYPYGASAGNWAILHGSDGHQYWYMHLQRHLVGDGASVSAGRQVATNGDTGNARGTPHVHFELHPGGGGAVNPYPTLRSVCG